MLLLVALAAALGIVLLLPPLMVARYLAGRAVIGFLLVYIALLAAPLFYAWRTRPFRDS